MERNLNCLQGLSLGLGTFPAAKTVAGIGCTLEAQGMSGIRFFFPSGDKVRTWGATMFSRC